MASTRGAALMQGVSERWERGVRILEIADPQALTQAIGWLKFTGDPRGLVLYRGQTRLHHDMVPAAYRGRSQKSCSDVSRELSKIWLDVAGVPCRCKAGPFAWARAHLCDERLTKSEGAGPGIVSSVFRAAVETLLQHYGIRTRWLDVVDNIWIALWFACHTQIGTDEFAFHLRRSPAQEGPSARAYVAVLESGELSATHVPGYQVAIDARVVDLRRAVPSVYLRPHAQHGFLIAKNREPDANHGSMGGLLAAILEIRLEDALDWLGTGVMTHSHVLFPPAAKDEGYRRLLKAEIITRRDLGAITAYGPGY